MYLYTACIHTHATLTSTMLKNKIGRGCGIDDGFDKVKITLAKW